MHSPLNEKFGIQTEDLPDGTVALSLQTDASYTNEIGAVHGGITMLLLDGSMGRAAGRTLKPGQMCATIQFTAQFLLPAEGRLRAVGRVVRRGREVAFLEGECTREDGAVIARALGTWAIR
ncbi:MAG: PaaI family thioesterase [Planctomycetes bacterium]|nr:PaaI family thioesterase [Planctomycetota bacterium]